MVNLTRFGKMHYQTYLNDYSEGKISFKECISKLGCCFDTVNPKPVMELDHFSLFGR